MIEAVEIPAPDGVLLRGELRRREAEWVVLVHDSGEDLDAWRPLAGALARRRLSVLAFDLRGHGGSDGEADPDRTADDVAAAVSFSRSSGARRVVVGAAGASVGPALEAAAASGSDGVFALGPVGERYPSAPALPRLAVCGMRDPRQQRAAAGLRRTGGRPLVVQLPLAESGAGLLRGSWATNVEAYVVGFLGDVLARSTRAAVERRPPTARSRGGNQVSPASPLLLRVGEPPASYAGETTPEVGV